jgi:hypothetical protein
MERQKALDWLGRMIWILVYGGLILLIVGYRTLAESATAGWALMIAGAVITVLGFFLIWMRSRIPDSTIDK